MIKVILWDIDGTLLNFKMSERYAIDYCFNKFHMGTCTDEMLQRYSVINRGYWGAAGDGRAYERTGDAWTVP